MHSRRRPAESQGPRARQIRTLIPLDDAILASSQTLLPATIATLDAIHLATALRLAAGGVLDTVMTYDRRLADGAAHHGLRVLAPA